VGRDSTQTACCRLRLKCDGTPRARKPDFVFRWKGRVHLNRPGGRRQFSRLLTAEMCTSAVVMLDTPCSEVVWSVLATHSIRQFPLHFPSLASPCAITFQLDSTKFMALEIQEGTTVFDPFAEFSIKIWKFHSNFGIKWPSLRDFSTSQFKRSRFYANGHGDGQTGRAMDFISTLFFESDKGDKICRLNEMNNGCYTLCLCAGC